MIKQGTKEWFDQRKGRITGSVIGAVLGLNPWQTKQDVMRAMVRSYHGAPNEFTGNIATEHGKAFEPMATEDLELFYNIKVEETGFHAYEDWLGASPDGLYGDDTVIEIKCPYSKRDESGSDFKPLLEQMHYYAQVQFEMFCTNRVRAVFYQWSPAGGDKIEVIYRDDVFINESLPVLKQFYKDYLKEINNMSHLEDETIEITDKEIVALAEEYKAISTTLKTLDARKKEILEKVIDAAGGVDAIVNGMKLKRVFRDGSISYAKAIKDIAPDADLEQYKGKPSEFWTLK